MTTISTIFDTTNTSAGTGYASGFDEACLGDVLFDGALCELADNATFA